MSSSKKQTTSTVSNGTTSGTTNLVQTPTNPAFVTQGLGAIGDKVNTLVGQDPYSFVAGPDPLLTQAGAGASGLGTPTGFADASRLANGVGSAPPPSIASHLAEFQDPWLNDVVKTTLAGFDQNAGYSRAGDTLARAGDTTFGGSGGAIQTALNEQNIGRDRASTEADLRSKGFTTALGGATSQAGLDSQAQAQRLAAAGVLSGNASAEGANGRANIDTQSQIGQLLQALAQAKAGAPINSLGSISSILSSLPLSLLHGDTSAGTAAGTTSGTTNGTTTETSSDPLGSLGSLLKTAGALGFAPFTGGASLGLGAIVSDRRLKWDIEKIGEMTNGLGVYFFRYLWSPRQHVGVMAQEVQKVKPEAVVTLPSGYMAVNYGML